MTASESSRVQGTERETFHIALLSRHQTVKKCYGCEGAIKATHDVILQTFCHREYLKRKEGTRAVTAKKTGAYFHLNLNCVRKSMPAMELKDVIVHDKVRSELSDDQMRKLMNFGARMD